MYWLFFNELICFLYCFQGYCVAIYLVKKLSSDILMMRLKQFGNRHPDHTRALSKFYSLKWNKIGIDIDIFIFIDVPLMFCFLFSLIIMDLSLMVSEIKQFQEVNTWNENFVILVPQHSFQRWWKVIYIF